MFKEEFDLSEQHSLNILVDLDRAPASKGGEAVGSFLCSCFTFSFYRETWLQSLKLQEVFRKVSLSL